MAVVGDVPVRVMMMGTKKDMAKLGSNPRRPEEAVNLGESPYVHHMRQRDAQLRDLNSNTIQSIERNIQSEEAQGQEGNKEEEGDEEQMSVYGDDKSQLHNGINLAPQRLTDAPIRSNQFEYSPSAYGSCACACPGKADEVEHHCYDVVDEMPNGDASMASAILRGNSGTRNVQPLAS